MPAPLTTRFPPAQLAAGFCSQILLPRGFEDCGAAEKGHRGQQKLPVQRPSRGAAALACFFGPIQVGETCHREIHSSKAFCASRDAGRGDFKEVPTGPARLGVLHWLAAGGRLRPAQSRSYSFRRDPVNPVRPDRGSLTRSLPCTLMHACTPLPPCCFPGVPRGPANLSRWWELVPGLGLPGSAGNRGCIPQEHW